MQGVTFFDRLVNWAITFLSYMIKGHNFFQWCFLTFSTLKLLKLRVKGVEKSKYKSAGKGYSL